MSNWICLSFALLTLLGCSSKKESQEEEAIRPVKYGVITSSQGKSVFSFSGVAQSDRQAELSFRVAGTVRSMRVRLGDRVLRGQVIATLDPTDYDIQAQQASASQKGTEANLQSAETQLIIARSNYQRIEKLFENNNVPLSEFEQAKSQLESAASQYEAAKTQVSSAAYQTQAARNQVNYTRLQAPFNGIVTDLLVEENELVGSGKAVAVLNSEEGQEVNVGIPENFISKVRKGQKVQVLFSVLGDTTFRGTVREVSFAAGSSPTYPAIIGIDDPSAEIRPGMAARATFSWSDAKDELPEHLVCPVSAVGEQGDANFVFVLTKNKAGNYAVEKRPITIGELLPTGFEVLSGVQKGELVATAGLRALLNGMQVTLLDN